MTTLSFAFDFSLCDSPQRAMDELGDDYYALCERNVAPDYYSDTPDAILAQKPTPASSVSAPVLEQYPGAELDMDSTSFFTKHAILLTGVAGLCLFCILLWLILWHRQQQRRLKKATFTRLEPFIRQYLQAGYSLEQIRSLLLEQGYAPGFINDLFVSLELSP